MGMTVRAQVVPGERINRVVLIREQWRAAEATLADAEDLRDSAALLEAKARDARRRAQALVVGLVADHKRRQIGRPAPPTSARPVASQQLRRARQLARVSQRQLAATWGYSRGAIAAYEDNLSPHRVPDGICAWVRQVLRVAGELDEAQP